MQNFKELSEDLSVAGYEFYRRGWVFGTSGNFSAKISENPLQICITASGNDKGALDETHFLEIDDNADVLQGFGSPSAETMLHLTIYRMLENVGFGSAYAFGLGNDSCQMFFTKTAQSRSKATRCSKVWRA